MQDPNFIPVMYIGKRERYVEGMYGTRIVWFQGETQLVPAAKAKLLLGHPDVYVLGDSKKPAAMAEIQEKEPQEDKEEELRQSVSLMDKATLDQYAKTHFKVDLDRRKNVDVLRSQVVALIDQYGVE
jgi:hypothetical protein